MIRDLCIEYNDDYFDILDSEQCSDIYNKETITKYIYIYMYNMEMH